MTPAYALTQLLKLGDLSFDEIVKYTGWTEDKAAKTVTELLGSQACKWKHKPSRFSVLENRSLRSGKSVVASCWTPRGRTGAYPYGDVIPQSGANRTVYFD